MDFSARSPTFAEKMSNPAFMSVCFEGERRELRSLYGKMKRMQETAWQPPFALLKLIQKVYPSLVFYFEAEGDDWDAYLTNDAEGKYFSSRYIVDCEPDIEYFDTIAEACNHLSAYIGKPVNASWQALNEAADEWNDEHPDSDWSINVKQIEVISNDELWE